MQLRMYDVLMRWWISVQTFIDMMYTMFITWHLSWFLRFEKPFMNNYRIWPHRRIKEIFSLINSCFEVKPRHRRTESVVNDRKAFRLCINFDLLIMNGFSNLRNQLRCHVIQNVCKMAHKRDQRQFTNCQFGSMEGHMEVYVEFKSCWIYRIYVVRQQRTHNLNPTMPNVVCRLGWSSGTLQSSSSSTCSLHAFDTLDELWNN